MRPVLLALLFLASPAGAAGVPERLAAWVLSSTSTYADLSELTAIGPRLGGTAAAERAVDWGRQALEAAGADRVWVQPVQVPRWERGEEGARAVWDGGALDLAVAALGGSVGTSSGPIEAEVVEADGLEGLKRLGAEARGRIVFFNRPMDPALADAFEAYGKAVGQRTHGASRAADLGAVAVLVRSMTTLTDDPLPHTGGVFYSSGTIRIPAAALSTRSAGNLSALIKKHPGLRVRLSMGARNLPPVVSRNVVAELRGRQIPGEIVVIGGHIDSWDLGPGAHDDGAGVVESIAALRALRALGLRPKRTVRVVLFMSEEVGGVGGREYARLSALNGEKHAAALESDRGGFAPLGFSASTATLALVAGWKPALSAARAGRFFPGGTGTDTGWLEEQGVPSFELIPEPRHYFDYHHSARDTFEAVKPKELAQGAAAVAVFAWVAAEEGIPPPAAPVSAR